MTTAEAPAGIGGRDINVAPGRLYIGGEWREAEAGAVRKIIDPATGRMITTVAEAAPQDAASAAGAARAMFDDGRWARLHPRERGRILLRAAEILSARAAEFAELETLDAGKPIMFSRTVDVATAIETFEYYGALVAGLAGTLRPPAEPALAYTRREPVGVVAAITPFTFPLILSVAKIAPALAAGNTIVHKPAEETPLTALRLAEVLRDAGVPDGVFNVITGGVPTGRALVADPRVDKIAFTGSSVAGRRIAETAARSLKQVTIDLGGKGTNIIFAEADLEAAINTAVSAFGFCAGHFCMAGSRLLVERPVYGEVLDALAGAIEHIPIGDPFAEGTVLGPLAGPEHLAAVRSCVSRAEADGVRVLGGGPVPTELGGFFVSPAVLAGVDQSSPYVQEEIFGPVLTVQPFDTEDEAVHMANGTPYGLAAGLQTRDMARAHRAAAALRAGIVWVNAWGTLDVSMPFGGSRQSGYGREHGPEGLDEYLQTKSVVVALG